jgi:hypothetical protein
MRTILLFAAAALFTVACSDPYEQGKELGEEHVELVREDALTYERFTDDLEEARADLDAEAERKKFDEGYEDAVAPVRAEIAAMVVEHAASEAGEAVADVMEAFGRGVGRMAGGFLDGMKKSKANDADVAEEADLKELGRAIGRKMRDVGEDLETVAEGIEEGMNEQRAE